MAASARQRNLVLLSWMFLALVSSTSASPLLRYPHDFPVLKRDDPLVTLDNGTQVILDPQTSLPITQGSASDGAGVNFSPPAIIWLAWALTIGISLTLAGIRLWRATTGASLGIACAVCVWASFVNTQDASGIPDLLLTVIAMGAFAIGFFFGLFDMARTAAIFALGILGGFSIGVRFILFRPGLLIPSLVVNWIIIMFFGIIGFVLVISRQRAGITVCSSAVGTFLSALGIDLLINRQAGMSLGLRFLFDRNSSHMVELFTKGWHPPVVTEIIMAVSLLLIPAFAYLQHRVFKQPFKRVRRPLSLASIRPSEDEKSQPPRLPDLLSPDDESGPQASLMGSTEKLLRNKEPSEVLKTDGPKV